MIKYYTNQSVKHQQRVNTEWVWTAAGQWRTERSERSERSE